MLTAAILMDDDESRELQSPATRFCAGILDWIGSRRLRQQRAAASCVYRMLTPKSLF
jgi:hypothetical protein